MAAGMLADATFAQCVGVGNSTTCAGTDSLALGHGATITIGSDRAVAAGRDSQVSADDGIGIGRLASVSATQGVCIGGSCSITGSRGVGVGQSSAAGAEMVAIGGFASATGSDCICVGKSCSCTHTKSAAFGRDVVSTASGTATFGVIDSGTADARTDVQMAGNTRISGDAQNGQEVAIKGAHTLISGLSGATANVTNALPAGSVIIAVVARVTTTITGATTWDLGDGTDVDRFGAAIVLAAGTTVDTTDWTITTPPVYTAVTDLVLTANGSNFTAGAVRFGVYYIQPTVPGS
jgi:hypothetical protein